MPDDSEKQFNKAVRVIFKSSEQRTLTAEANEACHLIGVKPESLTMKLPESFMQGTLDESDKILEQRYTHYEQRRKRKLTTTCLTD